jgi:hypothetical protein
MPRFGFDRFLPRFDGRGEGKGEGEVSPGRGRGGGGRTPSGDFFHDELKIEIGSTIGQDEKLDGRELRTIPKTAIVPQ